jgi:hypothetical protein
MNINASSQTLINTLLQQATKTSEKKRPTFEEVFAKLNARTSKINANRQPINAMLTNEQLFRYYIKETEPKLSVSNETFSAEELFNPVKESDPNKVYGQGATLTSDISQSRDPANNLPIVGLPSPILPEPSRARQAPQVSQIPSPYTPEQERDIQEAEAYIEAGTDFLNYFNNINMNDVEDVSKEFLNVIFAKGLGDGDWPQLGQYMFDRLNNRLDEGNVVADLYNVMGVFRAMPDGLTKYFIPRAIFKLTSPDNTTGTIDDWKAILQGSELDLRKRFYNHRDTNGGGLKQSDGTYSSAIRAEGERQFDKYSLDKFDPVEAIEAFIIGDSKARLDYIKTGKEFEGDIGEEGWVNPRLLEVRQNRRLGETGVMIRSIIDDLFNDVATQLTTNTDINSVLIDDQLIDIFAARNKQPAKSSTDISQALTVPSSSSFSSTTAEAGSAGVDIDDVFMRVPRGRGVQPGDIRGPYAKPKKVAQDILGNIIESAVDIAEAKPKKKK